MHINNLNYIISNTEKKFYDKKKSWNLIIPYKAAQVETSAAVSEDRTHYIGNGSQT